MSGFFIAFEGLDGLGKSTQVARLAATLAAGGHQVITSREPTDGPIGREIRRLAREGRGELTPEAEVELFVRDRADDVAHTIRPALARGAVVLVDRYFYSNVAYQGALGVPEAAIREANRAFPVPDLVLLFEAPPEVGLARIRAARGGGTDQAYEHAAFLAEVRARYEAMRDPVLARIDATGTPDEVAARVAAVVRDRLTVKSS